MADKGEPCEAVGLAQSAREVGPDVRHDEGAQIQERIQALKRSKASYLGHLTKLYKEAELLMLKRDNKHEVMKKVIDINVAYDRYASAQALHALVLKDYNQDEFCSAKEAFELQKRGKVEFDDRVAPWLTQKMFYG